MYVTYEVVLITFESHNALYGATVFSLSRHETQFVGKKQSVCSRKRHITHFLE